MSNREVILSSDYSQVPLVVSKLSLETQEQISDLFNLSLKIRDQTPYSFRILAENLGIFSSSDIDQLKLNYETYSPNNLQIMPIFVSELIYISYQGVVECPDENCNNYQKSIEKLSFEISPKMNSNVFTTPYFCFYCKRKKKAKRENHYDFLNKVLLPKNFIIIDIRLTEGFNKSGFLPMSLVIDEHNNLNSIKFVSELIEKFDSEKGKYHFIIVTSETDYFSEFETKYYKDVERKRTSYRLLPQSNSRIANDEEINKITTTLQEFKLKEYNTFKDLTGTFCTKKFPYISYVHGGFKEFHTYANNYKIPLLSHQISECKYCKEHTNEFKEIIYISGRSPDNRRKKTNPIKKAKFHNSTLNNFSLSFSSNIELNSVKENNQVKKSLRIFDSEEIFEILNDKSSYINFVISIVTENQKFLSDENIQVNILLIISDAIIRFVYKDLNSNNGKYLEIESIKLKKIISVKSLKNDKTMINLTYFKGNENTVITIELADEVQSRLTIERIRKFMDSI